VYEYRLHYRAADGNTYTINDSLRAFLLPGGLAGFGLPRGEVPAARRPYRDGAFALAGPYTPARELGVAIQMRALAGEDHADLEVFRRQMARNLSAKAGSTAGWLVISQDDTDWSREIQCWLVEAGGPSRDGPFLARVVFVFWAETPWFRDAVQSQTIIALGTIGGLTFPITFPITFATSTINDHVTIENLGDVEVWPTIRINGPGTNPSIENETLGVLLALTGVLEAGDYVDVDMDAATVMFYDASAGTYTSWLNYLSAASEFWKLRRGANVVHVQMTGVTSGSIVISFYPLYESI
jgi:hypothetical protein